MARFFAFCRSLSRHASRRYFLLPALLGTLSQPACAQAPLPPSRAARIAAVENSLLPYVPVEGLPGWNLRDRMRHHRVPGLSIAVIHDYQIDWVQGYGLADTTTRQPVTPATLFSAGSISKLATAAIVMRLAQEGRLDLDTPINRYLRGWQLGENERTAARPVTLRLLLSHRAGTSQSAYWGFVPRPTPYPSVVQILRGEPGTGSRPVVVNQAIGEGFSYSGGGYLVAQQALTDLTDRDFQSLAAATLFAPLRMRSATFAQPLPAALARRAAWAYSGAAWYEGMPYVYPQQAPAGLYASPTDLARLIIEIQQAGRGQGKVLSAATVAAMLTPQAEVSTGTYREEIGLGAFLLQRADRPPSEASSRYFEHTGRNAGFLAYAIGSVEGGEGVVIMMNDDGGAAELGKEIRRAVARVYGWPCFLPPAVRPVPRTPAELDALAGRYQRGPDELVTFRREGPCLVQQIGGALSPGEPILCVPAAGDTLAFTDFPFRAVFTRDAAGRVSGYRMLGSTAIFRRLPDAEKLPHELLLAGRCDEATTAYRALNQTESELTYTAYELINRRPNRPGDLAAARCLLTLAQERFPQSSTVFARWGDLYRRQGETARARAAYEQARQLNPTDDNIKALLDKLPAPAAP